MIQPMNRRFYVGMPVIYLYEDTTQRFALRFSNENNQPVISGPTISWFHLGGPTITESGIEVEHVQGFKLTWHIDYQIWPRDYILGDPTVRDYFTEREVGLLNWAKINSADVDTLFYPHDGLPGAGQSNDADYRVIIADNSTTRPGGAQDRVVGTIELRSKHALTDWEKFAWL